MLVHKASKSLVVDVPNPGLILDQLPGKARTILHEGKTLVQVRHTLQTAKVLNNLGIEAPSPIRYYYDFPCPPGIEKPMEHQIDTAEFVTLWRRCFVLNEMGTMKTASVLWAADYLMSIGVVGKVLVVAPMSTLELVWQREVFNFIMHRKAVVLHGSAERRVELLATDADFYIVNYEGLPIIARALRKRKDINLYIVDEAAAYRESRNVRYDTFEKLAGVDARPKLRLWMLTGTPTPNAPTDAWGLARLVNPERVPQYYTAWRRKTMFQKNAFKWLPRPGSHKLVFDALQPGIRFRKKDCVELPPVTNTSRDAPPTKEQKKLLRMMHNLMVADLKNGVQVTAINAADRVAKMRQILCGAIRDPETGAYMPVDHKPRLEVLMECIEQASAKVLVIIPYKGITNLLAMEVGKHYSCEIVNGDVSKKNRLDIFTRFKQDRDPHVLLCHPKVMAHGLTLTEADTLIFYAPISSNEQTQQVTERINRPGQKRKMTIVRIGGDPIEWDIYKTVDHRSVGQNNVLDLYAREIKRVRQA